MQSNIELPFAYVCMFVCLFVYLYVQNSHTWCYTKRPDTSGSTTRVASEVNTLWKFHKALLNTLKCSFVKLLYNISQVSTLEELPWECPIGLIHKEAGSFAKFHIEGCLPEKFLPDASCFIKYQGVSQNSIYDCFPGKIVCGAFLRNSSSDAL